MLKSKIQILGDCAALVKEKCPLKSWSKIIYKIKHSRLMLELPVIAAAIIWPWTKYEQKKKKNQPGENIHM